MRICHLIPRLITPGRKGLFEYMFLEKCGLFILCLCSGDMCLPKMKIGTPVLKQVYEPITSEKSLWLKREAIADRGPARSVIHFLVMP